MVKEVETEEVDVDAHVVILEQCCSFINVMSRY